MSAWVRSVLERARQIPEHELVVPQWEIQPGDQLIGEVPLELRQLWHLYMHMDRDAKISQADMPMLSGSEYAVCRQKALKCQTMATAIRHMFDVSCKDMFPDIWDKPVMGIRKGWKLVWFEHQLPQAEKQAVLEERNSPEVKPPTAQPQAPEASPKVDPNRKLN
ncbi:MAG: hypothetical protein JWO43_509 [Candidatus Adlerbacteria bacterium]|nr:hypothetical protein [Candidatus Adlerbacteria bacterium]